MFLFDMGAGGHHLPPAKYLIFQKVLYRHKMYKIWGEPPEGNKNENLDI